MHKILVFGMTENPGGVESFLYNYISEMNLAEFQFDFYVIPTKKWPMKTN